jgi:hypothetical protein
MFFVSYPASAGRNLKTFPRIFSQLPSLPSKRDVKIPPNLPVFTGQSVSGGSDASRGIVIGPISRAYLQYHAW